MMLSLIMGVLLGGTQLVPSIDTPSARGRQGNAHMEKQSFEEARTAYSQGLEVCEEDETCFGLQHNQGLALYGLGDLELATTAFEAAATSAPEHHRSRAHYNAGNVQFHRQELETALQHYQEALITDPSNQEAKFNYEFVARQLQQNQEQQQQDQNDPQQDGDQEQDEDPPQEENSGQDEQSEQQESEQPEQSQPQDEQQSEDEQSQEVSEPGDAPLTREQAVQMLEAMENEEEELLRAVQKLDVPPRRVAKDW